MNINKMSLRVFRDAGYREDKRVWGSGNLSSLGTSMMLSCPIKMHSPNTHLPFSNTGHFIPHLPPANVKTRCFSLARWVKPKASALF